MSKKNILIVLCIFIVTILTRFLSLENNPPHLSNDEISIAYDAYSVSRTLRDEHNHFLPISFQSHNTYKAPLTIYLSIPFNLIFGNSTTSARLPSAVLGCLTVLLVGLVAYELSGKNINIGLMASLIMATSPAHIYSSRMIQEANIALFFVVCGFLFLLKSLKKNRFTLLHSVLGMTALALSIYSYHTEWGFVPLAIISFYFVYRRNIINKSFIISLFVFFVLISPIFINFIGSLGGGSRASTELLFKDPVVANVFENIESSWVDKFSVFSSKFIHNYSNHFNLGLLFFYGQNFFASVDPVQIGYFLFPILIGFILGLIYLKKFFSDNAIFILIILLITPTIPSLTIGDVSTYRYLLIVFPISIISAAGFYWLFNKMKNNLVVLLVLGGIVVVSFFYYYVIFYKYFPISSAENYQYGYKQIAELIRGETDKYQKIIVDPRFGASRFSRVPHLYLPYYLSLDPKYLLERKDSFARTDFWKFEIRQIDWDNEKLVENYLYIVPSFNKRIDDKLKIKNTILLPDNKPAFVIYEN